MHLDWTRDLKEWVFKALEGLTLPIPLLIFTLIDKKQDFLLKIEDKMTILTYILSWAKSNQYLTLNLY